MNIKAIVVKMLFIPLLFLMGCKGKNTETETETKSVKQVKIEEVTSNSQNGKLSFNGIVKEKSISTLSFRVGGPLVELNVKPGDFVKKGQVIAAIDKRDYKIQLQSTQAQYKQLEGEYERYKELYEKDKVPANSFEKIESGYLMAKTGYENAVNQLHDTELKAPFSGYIHDKMTENFQTVGPGQPIVSIIDLSQLEVVVSVSENLINSLNKNTQAFITVRNAGIANLPVKIESIGEKSKQDGLYEVKLSFANKSDFKINPGMTAEVSMVCENETTALEIPSTAIFKDGNSPCIWKYNSETHTISKQAIKIESFTSGGKIQVSSGVKSGDMIVTAGVYELSENQEVQPIKKPSKTNVGGLL